MAVDLRNGELSVNGVVEGSVNSDGLQISVTDGVDPVTPDDVIVSGSSVEIQVPAASAPVGATLLKTGQSVSYRTGDDGDLEAGRATDFLTLASNNPFGNTNRFTDELGGSTYTNNIVIDWSTYDGSTVLGYRRTTNGVDINWNDAIDGALSVSISTFTSGWRLSNVKEIQNIQNLGLSGNTWLNYSPFNINQSGGNILWTSNTLGGFSTLAIVSLGYCNFEFQDKTQSVGRRYIPVRTFTVTGTTLS